MYPVSGRALATACFHMTFSRLSTVIHLTANLLSTNLQVAMPLLRLCYASALPLLCLCYASALPLLWFCHASAIMAVPCFFNASSPLIFACMLQLIGAKYGALPVARQHAGKYRSVTDHVHCWLNFHTCTMNPEPCVLLAYLIAATHALHHAFRPCMLSTYHHCTFG